VCMKASRPSSRAGETQGTAERGGGAAEAPSRRRTTLSQNNSSGTSLQLPVT
jgi:hypothetical protein